MPKPAAKTPAKKGPKPKPESEVYLSYSLRLLPRHIEKAKKRGGREWIRRLIEEAP
jgi:hypothetical protein